MIHVSIVKTYPDGTLTSNDASGAEVKVTCLSNTAINKTAYTDVFGIVKMNLNLSETAPCNISISYNINITKKALFESHIFYPDPTQITYLYESVYDLAKMQEIVLQRTEFQLIKIHLPGCVRFDFPESTNINASIESYGLKWNSSKTSENFIIVPLDISEPTYYANGTFRFRANYTVNLSFTTLKEGFISLTVIDNATGTIIANPLYYVNRYAYVKIKFAIFVSAYYMEKQLAEILSMLQLIYESVKRSEKMLNTSVIPLLNFIKTPFLTYLSIDNMTNFQTRLTSIYGLTTLNRDILLSVHSDLGNQTLSGTDIALELAGYAQNFYIISAVMAILLIVVAVTIRKKEKIQKTEKPKMLIRK